MKHYLIIFEDYNITKLTTDCISKSTIDGCLDGILQIVDITDPENPKEYKGGETWDELETWAD